MKFNPILLGSLFTVTALVVWLLRSTQGGADSKQTESSTEKPSVRRAAPLQVTSRDTDEWIRRFPDTLEFQNTNKPVSPSFQIPAELATQLEQLHAMDPTEEGRSALILEIANQWAALDLQGALSWAFTLERGNDRVALRKILRTSGSDDPVSALKALDTLKSANPDLHHDGERPIFRQWAAMDPHSAWEAASSVTNPQQLANVQHDILLQWSQAQPAAVAAILKKIATNASSQTHLSAVFETTAGFLADENPSETARWIASLPEGDARSSATSSILGSWLQQDFPSAVQWLSDDLQPGKSQDAGISKLVSVIRNREPQIAVQWAARISDPALRTHVLTSASLSWWAMEPEAASQAVNQSDFLSEEEKDSIREIFASMQN